MTIEQILDCLAFYKIRATYGAVGDVLGIPARSVSQLLGERRKEASWIVSAATGKPAGYKATQYHPDLFARSVVIADGRELLNVLADSIQDSTPKEWTTDVTHQMASVPTADTHSKYLAGIDLAWMSESNGSGIAIGSITENRLTIETLHTNVVGLANVKSVLDACDDLRGVAVDAPLIIENRDGSRPCERQLSSVYSSRWAGCHPSNLKRYPDASSVALSRWLSQLGMEHLGSSGRAKWQIECYPHPAIIELFDLPRRHAYKKGSIEERRCGQIELANYLLGLEQDEELRLNIPEQSMQYFSSDYIASLTARQLKANEDLLDAVICLYIAGWYASGQPMSVFGDTDTGYIVVPTRQRHSVFSDSTQDSTA